MAKRKNLGKKIRFEVFKRDSFTCQYCGQSAPQVILEVDHIIPVSKGGDNDLTNLITSCRDCNRGKSNIELSDDTVVVKQQKELEELQERKNQLEMMVEWRNGLKELDQSTVKIFCDEFTSLTGADVNETGQANVSRWINKYSITTLFEALDRSISQYYDAEKIFIMIPKIAYYVDHPEKQINPELFYIKGILKNRLTYFDERKAMYWLKEAVKYCEIYDLKEIAKEVKNWTEFRETIQSWIAEGEYEQNNNWTWFLGW